MREPRSTARRLALLGVAIEMAAWSGLVVFYDRAWLQPNAVRGNLDQWLGDVVRGRSAAPYQYRVLAPHVIMWINGHSSLGIERASLVLDVSAMIVGALAAHWMFVSLGMRWAAVAGAFYGSFLGIGLLWWGKPEAMPAFAAATVLCAVLCVPTERRWVIVALAALVLAGTRTDLLGAFAVAWTARWWVGRRTADLVGGVSLGALAAVATEALKHAFPQARYPAGIGMIQIFHNFQPTTALIATAFLLPSIGPLVVARHDPAAVDELDRHHLLLFPIGLLVAAEVGFALVFGRIDEVRLLFPLTAPLTLIAALSGRALLRALGLQMGDATDVALAEVGPVQRVPAHNPAEGRRPTLQR